MEELEKKLRVLANDYDDLTFSDYQGCLMALETMYGVHYQELFNKCAKIIIEKRIESMKNETMDFSSRVEFCKQLEKEFDCNIDYVDYSIDFLYK